MFAGVSKVTGKPYSHHDPDFTQWCDDFDIERYCRSFSRQS